MGSAAVQLAAAVGARPLGVASPRNHDYLRVCRSITRLGVSPALFAGMTGAVMVGLPGAAQDRLPADVPGAQPGRPGVPE
jgi:hypothetical protein